MTLVTVDPVLVEIVQGTLGSIEAEVEEAIGRTARSPMIRDQHDFRAGIHDRKLRKLTGRSYSALVHPVARDFPLETMAPGDVFFHHDVYSPCYAPGNSRQTTAPFPGGEDGLLGILLDPGFRTNSLAYLVYTARSANEQRLSRFEIRNVGAK